MSYQALRQYIELYHYAGIADFFIGKGTKPVHDKDLAYYKAELMKCKKCALNKNRYKIVYGIGNSKGDCLIISDPPTTDENLNGRPFVDKIRDIFLKILDKLEIKPTNLYITNITKCKATIIDYNEMRKCLPNLIDQINVIKPKIILVFGEVAANIIMGKTENIEYFRKTQGSQFQGIPVYFTYNISQLEKRKELRTPAFSELQLFAKEYKLLN
jgi:DNA polymerase